MRYHLSQNCKSKLEVVFLLSMHPIENALAYGIASSDINRRKMVAMTEELITIRAGSGSRFVSLEIAADFDAVFKPSMIGRIFIEELSKLDLAGRTLLDVGCGSGVLGIAGAKFGARVTCIDVNEAAVLAATANGARNGVVVEGICSDGFNSLKDKRYDVIVANCPLLPPQLTTSQNVPQPTSLSQRGLFETVITESGTYLNESGSLLTSCCEFVDIRRFEEMMKKEWDIVEVTREFCYDFGAINKNLDIEKLSQFEEAGLLQSFGGRFLCLARFYLLRKIA